jgi:hypothetical protein
MDGDGVMVGSVDAAIQALSVVAGIVGVVGLLVMALL